MDTKSREKKRFKSITRLFKSFKYAFDGIIYAFKYEQNITVHFLVGIIVLIAGYYFKINMTEWAILVVTMTMVVSLEMINSCLEAVVDLCTEKYHPLAKVGKDCAAGAVLIMAIGAIIVGMIIFVPKIF